MSEIKAENKIIIYTDGSCRGNPGPGGWAAIIMIGDKMVKLAGRASDTTNNRMEMMAIIKALSWLRGKDSPYTAEKLQKANISLHSDSNLIIQTLTLGWKRKKNTDLWEKLDQAATQLQISWNWVKGHSTNKYNNLVDEMALEQATKALKSS